jgi:multisubunit Na+/H+ antiporter MnhB subunit
LQIRFDARQAFTMVSALIFMFLFILFFRQATASLSPFGEASLRMSEAYIYGAYEQTGSLNLVTGILFDFRGYDTLGEATVLFTAVMGVLTIIRLRGKK